MTRDMDPNRPYNPAEAAELRAQVDALGIRNRLGRKLWLPPAPLGEGWQFEHRNGTIRIFVTPWWEGEVLWVHASTARRFQVMPSYEDLKAMAAAVWPNGHAYQCFVPADEHINITANALHLWGRADGARVLPDFGRWGTI